MHLNWRWAENYKRKHTVFFLSIVPNIDQFRMDWNGIALGLLKILQCFKLFIYWKTSRAQMRKCCVHHTQCTHNHSIKCCIDFNNETQNELAVCPWISTMLIECCDWISWKTTTTAWIENKIKMQFLRYICH